MNKNQRSHYEVLNLPEPSSLKNGKVFVLQPADIRKAYKAALLRHHPDKSIRSTTSIDEITKAYTVLIDPEQREIYDASLFLPVVASEAALGTGEEAFSLDELFHDPNHETWTRGCRCGLAEGFMVHEKDLEAAAQDGAGEVIVGCSGCSLRIRVGFEMA
jgi:diphthamide biosynthesis protein 4